MKEGSTTAVILDSAIAGCIYVLTKICGNKAAESLIDILHYKAANSKS